MTPTRRADRSAAPGWGAVALLSAVATCGGLVADRGGAPDPDDEAPLDASPHAKDNAPSSTEDDSSSSVGGPVSVDADSPTDSSRTRESSAATPDAPRGTGICVPKTCAMNGYDCGLNADGCGGMEDCGNCTPALECGAGGFSRCGAPPPIEHPLTCQDLGYDCGESSDGFGNLLDCGTCLSPAFCGGGGLNRCGIASDAAAEGG